MVRPMTAKVWRRRPSGRAALPLLLAVTLAVLVCLAAPARAQQLLTALPQVAGDSAATAFDGVVEAVRQTQLAAQVAGAVVEIHVTEGDRVEADQVLLRIDARAAEQSAAASEALVMAAHAALAVAGSEFERQQQLFEQNSISQAALERAESVYKSAAATANAQLAQARAMRTQSGHHVVRAPYAGIIAEVPVTLGDMALPGRPLLTLYDPTALRVAAAVPQSAVARMQADPQHPDRSVVLIELPGAGGARIAPQAVQVLPTLDAATHTVQLRAALPGDMRGVVPGMFARLWLSMTRLDTTGVGAPPVVLSVPVEAVVRRVELTGLYVLDAQGKPVLRQVRLGRVADGRVEILSGLMPDEQVVLDPQAAVRAP